MFKKLYAFILMLLATAALQAQQTDSGIAELYTRFGRLQAAAGRGNPEQVAASANAFIRTASTIDYKVISEGNLNILRLDATAISESTDITVQRKILAQLSTNMALIQRHFQMNSATPKKEHDHVHH